MTFEEIKALDHQYVMQSYGRFDVAVDHGRGATLWDTQGREYIDFTSGIGVCSMGYADEGWVKSMYSRPWVSQRVAPLPWSTATSKRP